MAAAAHPRAHHRDPLREPRQQRRARRRGRLAWPDRPRRRAWARIETPRAPGGCTAHRHRSLLGRSAHHGAPAQAHPRCVDQRRRAAHHHSAAPPRRPRRSRRCRQGRCRQGRAAPAPRTIEAEREARPANARDRRSADVGRRRARDWRPQAGPAATHLSDPSRPADCRGVRSPDTISRRAHEPDSVGAHRRGRHLRPLAAVPSRRSRRWRAPTPSTTPISRRSTASAGTWTRQASSRGVWSRSASRARRARRISRSTSAASRCRSTRRLPRSSTAPTATPCSTPSRRRSGTRRFRPAAVSCTWAPRRTAPWSSTRGSTTGASKTSSVLR